MVVTTGSASHMPGSRCLGQVHSPALGRAVLIILQLLPSRLGHACPSCICLIFLFIQLQLLCYLAALTGRALFSAGGFDGR